MKDFKEFVEQTKQYAKETYIPIARDKTIKTMVNIIKKEGYKNILEIGTAIGYSSCFLVLSSGGKLTTIEKDEERANCAQLNFKQFNLEDKVNLLIGDAQIEIEKLVQEGEKFDFIFLDGPKGQYINYFPYLKRLLKTGGTLFADNVLLGGLVNNKKVISHKNRSMAVNMKKFIKEISNDKSFETHLYEIDDGFIISKLKNSTV